MSSKFFKCKLFSFYKGKGILWFRLFTFKISLKHIINYEFKSDNNKGFFIGYWLITINNNK